MAKPVVEKCAVLRVGSFLPETATEGGNRIQSRVCICPVHSSQNRSLEAWSFSLKLKKKIDR